MSCVSNEPQEVLDQVRLSFEQFRRANEPRTRIPDELRQAAVEALEQGVSMATLRLVCGLSAKQVADWQMPAIAPSGERPCEPARVFEIGADAGAGEAASVGGAGLNDALELRLGNWAITIRGAAA